MLAGCSSDPPAVSDDSSVTGVAQGVRDSNGSGDSAVREAVSYRLAEKPLLSIQSTMAENLFGQSPVSVGGKRDQIQVLNVWASWCKPCVDEAPALREFAAELPEGVQLIGINASKYDDRDEVLDFVDRYRLQFPHVWDGDGALTRQLRALSYPTTAILNRQGEVVWLHTGPVTADGLKQLVKDVK